MSLKAVLFDMDGVIVDTEPLHRKAYFKTFEALGIEVSEELYSSFTGYSTKKTCETLIEKFGLSQSHEEITEMKRGYFKYLFDNDTDFELLPNVRNLFEEYQKAGITMILASSASMNTINWVFERFGIGHFFKAKVSGADLKESKPNPEIFNIAAELSGEDKAHCMVIEDSTNGILAAHRAGIFCSAYKSQHSKNQDYTLSNILVEDFTELFPEKIAQYFPHSSAGN